MPIVATARFQIDAKDDDSIEILILEKLKEQGCINLTESAQETGKSLYEVKNLVEKLVGELEIECNDDLCCIKTESFNSLVEKLNALRGAEDG